VPGSPVSHDADQCAFGFSRFHVRYSAKDETSSASPLTTAVVIVTGVQRGASLATTARGYMTVSVSAGRAVYCANPCTTRGWVQCEEGRLTAVGGGQLGCVPRSEGPTPAKAYPLGLMRLTV
jgi:hypothetical protein